MTHFYHMGADAAIAADHPVRTIGHAADQINLSGLVLPQEIAGQKGAYPLLLVEVLAYAQWVGLQESLTISQACDEQLPFLWLTGNHTPSPSTLNSFLSANMPYLGQILAQVFASAGQPKDQGDLTSWLYDVLSKDAKSLPRNAVSAPRPSGPHLKPAPMAAVPPPAIPALPPIPSLPPAPSPAPAEAPEALVTEAPIEKPTAKTPKPKRESIRRPSTYTPPPRMGPAKGLLGTMVRKEVLSHLKSLRFLVSAGLCLLMMITSSFVLLDNYTTRKGSYDTNIDGYRGAAERENSYYLLEFKGINIERPPSTLQAFFAGLEKNPDRRARMWSFLNPQYQGDMDVDPTPNMFPMVDYLFVVGVVMSLLAFIFSYDAVTGEREGGTLKLLLSYSLPRDVVILGKWIGGYLTLILPFIVGVIISIILALAKGRTLAVTANDWQALGICIFLSLMYIAVMYSVGLFVSVTVLRSSTAISVLLFIWVIFVLIVPNASPYVADQVMKVTSVSEWQARRNQALGDIVSEVTEEFKTFFEKNKNNLSKLQDFANNMLIRIREKTNATDEEQETTYRRQLNEQVRLSQYISLISPLAAYTYAATEIADTGIGRDQHLREYTYRYQDEYKNWIENKINSSTKGQANAFGFKEQKFDLSDMPVFNYKPRTLEQRFNSVIIPMGILAAFIIAFFMASYMSFLKKDIIG